MMARPAAASPARLAVTFAEENPDLADQLPHYPLPAQIWGNSPNHGYKLLLNSSRGRH